MTDQSQPAMSHPMGSITPLCLDTRHNEPRHHKYDYNPHHRPDPSLQGRNQMVCVLCLCCTYNSHGVGGNKCIYCKLGWLGYVSPLPIRGSRIIGHYTLINYLTQTEINPDNFTRFSYCEVSALLHVFSVHSICHA